MAKKKIEVKLIVNINDDQSISAGVGLDFDEKKFRTAWDVCLIKYLKDMMEQHAQPIVYAANMMAELNVKVAELEVNCDEC